VSENIAVNWTRPAQAAVAREPVSTHAGGACGHA
jgi:hypothetical protein